MQMQTRVKVLCAGIIASLAVFVPFFAVFDQLFIACWACQHDGRKMKFTLWADERALPFTLALCAVVFYVTVQYLQRSAPVDQQIRRRSLLIAGVSGVVVAYLATVAYVVTVFSRFSFPR